MTKTCSLCKRNLLFKLFHKKSTGQNGLDSRCKSCVKKQKQRQYQYKTNQLNSMEVVQDSYDLREEVIYQFLQMVRLNEDKNRS